MVYCLSEIFLQYAFLDEDDEPEPVMISPAKSKIQLSFNNYSIQEPISEDTSPKLNEMSRTALETIDTSSEELNYSNRYHKRGEIQGNRQIRQNQLDQQNDEILDIYGNNSEVQQLEHEEQNEIGKKKKNKKKKKKNRCQINNSINTESVDHYSLDHHYHENNTIKELVKIENLKGKNIDDQYKKIPSTVVTKENGKD